MTSSASAAWEMRLQEQAALVDKYMLMATCGTEKQRRSAYGLYRKHEQIYDLMLTNYSTRQVHDRLKKVAPFLKAGASANMDRYADMADDVREANDEQLSLLAQNLDDGFTNEEFNASFAQFQALHQAPVIDHEFPAAPSHVLSATRQDNVVAMHS